MAHKDIATNVSHLTIEEFSSNLSRTADQTFLVYELRKRYGNVRAVEDVSFGVRKSECFGLLGVNGAGKSTTFRMMTGGEIPDGGIMFLDDKDYVKNKTYFLSQMGYCPQNDALITSLNAYDHLRLFARLRGIPSYEVEKEVDTWINRLNLNACAKQPSGTYSGGNKRRLNIAIALIGLPSLVLLDEPTTGVDPGARRSLWNVIQSCQATGQAVVLTSHSMEECEALCNRLSIMVGGKLVCIGPSQELKQRFENKNLLITRASTSEYMERIHDSKQYNSNIRLSVKGTHFNNIFKAGHPLLSIGSNDAEHYAYNYIAGATFNRTNNNIVTAAFYNPTRAAYSLPISVNLLTNTILKTLVGNEYNIRFAVQEFPRARDESMIILEANMGVVEAYVIALLLVFFLFPLTALFVIHPLRENINNIKQLQRMAGASCLKYWGTMFAFDYVVFIMLSVVLVVGFIIVDCSLGLRIFGGIEFYLRCSNGTCITPLKFLDSFKEDISMEASLISLCLTPILYVLILCMLEFKFIPTMIAEIRGGKPDKIDQSFEEQVKKTKHNIAQEISKIRSGQTPKPIETTVAKEKSETNGTTPTNEEAPPNHVFLAYELRKLYGKLVAVQDVSFGVHQRECFGLLGVNGAGKTTTFKLITGEETPSNGIMYLGNKDLKQHRNHPTFEISTYRYVITREQDSPSGSNKLLTFEATMSNIFNEISKCVSAKFAVPSYFQKSVRLEQISYRKVGVYSPRRINSRSEADDVFDQFNLN
ncbi:unnamed protein product, partial [Trichogramma brassicae]